MTLNDGIVRRFAMASVVWGLVGMTVGLVLAVQLLHGQASVGPYATFGRLRPLHSHLALFGFIGNGVFAGMWYATQRLLGTRVASDRLATAHFIGWQLCALAAAVTLPLGMSQGREYAELEWPFDLFLTAVWALFAVNFFWTVARRRHQRLYVSVWFFMASVVAVGLLHVLNSLALPVSLTKSYPLFAGLQDALVAWWYGEAAVLFLTTMPMLGLFYYFLPRLADRPVHSHRLAVVQFWMLTVLSAWVGPSHLLNSALPEWAQSLGMIAALLLLPPSLAVLWNGCLTLRGAWQRVAAEPALRCLMIALFFYGFAALQAPIVATKGASSLFAFTDVVVAHVHTSALGWGGFLVAGVLYFIVPRLYGSELHSQQAASLHVSLCSLGAILYLVAMWIAGATEGLMWRAENPDGGLLYPSFVEGLVAVRAMYWARLVGGLLYVTGFAIFAWNLWQTARRGQAVDGAVDDIVAEAVPARFGLVVGGPVVVAVVVLSVLVASVFANPAAAVTFVLLALIVAMVFGLISGARWHRELESQPLPFAGLIAIAILAGGVVELAPLAAAKNQPAVAAPYTALELEGRDVYVAEGCQTCHSQMVRPFLWETARYSGSVTSPDDVAFDRPYQGGQRRIGPDLARVGGKYPYGWHYEHLLDPRALSAGSNMPSYAHLADQQIDFATTPTKLRQLRALGVPYSDADIAGASSAARAQAETTLAALRGEVQKPTTLPVDSKLIALMAYLQRLGRAP